MSNVKSSWLHRLAVLTAGATFLLIVVGALVVGKGAGLSVPDWPLSYGSFFPPMVGGIVYEHSHRLIAGAVGVLMTALTVGLWWSETRRWVRWLAATALLAVVAQAVLGGLTVLYLLPIPILIGHACLAQLFFCMTIALALVTSPHWVSAPMPTEEDSGFPSVRHLASATTAAILIQLFLGAARRHEALGLAAHLVWAGVVAVLVLWLLFLALNKLPQHEQSFRNLSSLAGFLLAVQLALGFGSYWYRLAPRTPSSVSLVVWTTTAHVSVGALLLGTVLLVALLAYRNLAAPGKAPSFAQSRERVA